MRHGAAKLSIIFVVGALFAVAARPGPTANGAAHEPVPQRRAQAPRRRPAPRPAYNNFSHATQEHRKSCDSCHKFPSKNWQEVRPKSDAFADITEFPEHASCLDCHRTQFFARERPVPQICSVCHVNATPRNTARHPFPTLAETYDLSARGRTSSSDFAVNFPHAKHEGLFAGHRFESGGAALFMRASFARARQDDPAKANAACATCHQTQQPQGDSADEFLTKPPKNLADGAYWPKKGTFKTTPRDHTTCFTCHSTESGVLPAPSDCAACHKLLPPERRTRLAAAHDDFDPKLAAAAGVTDRGTLLKWARRGSAKFRHEWPPHDLACADCHAVATMNTADEATKKVRVVSCGGAGSGCHIEPTPDGILNTEVAEKRARPSFECTKCHVLNGRLPLPDTHAAAITAATRK